MQFIFKSQNTPNSKFSQASSTPDPAGGASRAPSDLLAGKQGQEPLLHSRPMKSRASYAQHTHIFPNQTELKILKNRAVKIND